MTDLELLGISILLLRTVRVVQIILDYCQLQCSRGLRPSYQPIRKDFETNELLHRNATVSLSAVYLNKL